MPEEYEEYNNDAMVYIDKESLYNEIDKVTQSLNEVKNNVAASEYIQGVTNNIEEQLGSLYKTAEELKNGLRLTDNIEEEVTEAINNANQAVAGFNDIENMADEIEQFKENPNISQISQTEHVQDEILTKEKARWAFGWVAPEQRQEPDMISQLQEMGLTTKEDFKAYMREYVMPANEQELQNTFGQLRGDNISQVSEDADVNTEDGLRSRTARSIRQSFQEQQELEQEQGLAQEMQQKQAMTFANVRR